jgi:hypothetical protein
MGNVLVLRAQRVVLQEWKQDTPWAKAGEVTVALGGDIAKELGILPDGQALAAIGPPGEATSSAPTATAEQPVPGGSNTQPPTRWTFEDGDAGQWKAAPSHPEYQDNYATRCLPTTEQASEGRYALRCDFDGRGHPTPVRPGAFWKAVFLIERRWDLSGFRRLRLDVWSPIEQAQLAIALTTGEGWEWHESPPIGLRAGWNRGVAFDLTRSDYKTAPRWEFTHAIAARSDTRRLAVLYIPPKAPAAGSVYLDDIAFQQS